MLRLCPAVAGSGKESGASLERRRNVHLDFGKKQSTNLTRYAFRSGQLKASYKQADFGNRSRKPKQFRSLTWEGPETEFGNSI